jgi:hypothetical protein
MHSCTTSADCRTADGYACVDKGLSTKICGLPAETLCDDYLDNDFNGFMDCADPSCQALPACVPGTVAVGQPCALHSQCTASAGVNDPFCLDATNELYTNGYCSHFCDPTKPNDCGAGNACVLNTRANLHLCMVSCTSSSQCRTADGYSCSNGVCDI